MKTIRPAKPKPVRLRRETSTAIDAANQMKRIRAQLVDILDKADAEKRGLDDNEKMTYDGLEQRLDALIEEHADVWEQLKQERQKEKAPKSPAKPAPSGRSSGGIFSGAKTWRLEPREVPATSARGSIFDSSTKTWTRG